jgi:superfamily II DNA or RNA helicase
MVETLKRRLKTRLDFQIWFKTLNIIIIDECHKNTFNEIFKYIDNKCLILGFTATPVRIGNMPELGDYFSVIVEGPGIGNLITDNYLAKPEYFGVPVDLHNVRIKAGEFDEKDLEQIYKNDNQVFGGLLHNMNKHGQGKKTIIFCPTLETSKKIASEIPGCLHIDGEMSKEQRRSIIKKFESDTHGIITNIGILTTGYNCPDVERIVLYRATKSLVLYLQIIGRGSRVTGDKDKFMILDFGNNVMRHGFWHSDRKWSLENDRKRKVRADREDLYPIKDCPQCGCLVAMNTKICEFCGYEWKKDEQEQRFVELQMMEYGQIIKKISNGMTVQEMEDIRLARGYKVGWLLHQFKTEEQFYDYARLKKYKSYWVKYQLDRLKM